MNKDDDMSFEIMIHSEMDENSILDLLQQSFEYSSKKGGYISFARNVFKISQNALYDKSKAINDPDRWIYYRFNLLVFPEADVTIEEQKLLARKIMKTLSESCLAELVAEFEI